MPAVSAPAKVLVTGANGYIAVWVVRTLLEKGYAVRGTVRSEAKTNHLKKLFSDYGDKFECVVVEDITKEGAFDEAVKGVDVIEHTASPFHFNFKDPEELLEPAVKGTVGILESAKNHGKSVKRIIITASVASVLKSGYTPPVVYDESSWNDPAVADPQNNAYQASKTMAERAAWDFVEKNKASIGWDLTVLNPPWVFGPPIHEITDLSSLNTSTKIVYDVVVKGTVYSDIKSLTTASNCWIDVRDLALAHVLAAEKPAAGGERMVVYGGNFFWQDFLDIANAIEPPIYANLPKGSPGATKNVKQYDLAYDISKSDRILGLKYTSTEKMIKDSLEAYKKLEHE